MEQRKQKLFLNTGAAFSLPSGEAGLCAGCVAPLLDDGSLHPPGVGLGPGAHLLRHRDALLPGHQLRYQLGHLGSKYKIFRYYQVILITEVPHLVARLDGLQRTLLHWLVHHDGLQAVSADHGALEM